MLDNLSGNLIEQNRSVYNRIASFFSGTRGYVWSDLRPLAEYSKSGDVVLDLGCGNGRLYQILAKKQVRYVGLDQSEELIKIARAKFSEVEFPEVEFGVGEMSTLPFSDTAFNLVYCIAALNHIPGHDLQLQCVREMHRVLKTGGRLLMTNWNLLSHTARAKAAQNNWLMESHGEGVDVMVPWKNSLGENLGERYYHGFTLAELQELCIAAGFKIEDQYYSHKGARVSVEEGANLITIARKI